MNRPYPWCCRRNAEVHAAALDSACGQTLPPDEIIVVDDASSDATAAIAAGRDGATVIRAAGRGAASAMNEGVRRARGEFIALLSGDDRWLADKLARQVPFLRSRPDAIACITHFRYFVHPGQRVPPGFNRALLDCDLPGRIPETLLARREAFTDVLGYFREDLVVAYDVEWFTRLLDRGLPLPVLPEVLLLKGVHTENASHNAALNTRLLLGILRDSIHRRRETPRRD